ncbi:MAG: helicase-related protein [Pseudomonadota bacterium]
MDGRLAIAEDDAVLHVRGVDQLAKSLQKYGYNARPIHGDLPQAYRMETLAGFRAGDIQLLIASDVAARGLDIPDVSHVFNFDVPIHAEDYVHRIGRTGRAGREGAAFMLVCPDDKKFYGAILKEIGREAIDEDELDPAIFDGVEDKPGRERKGRRRDGERSGRPERSRGERRGRGRRSEREDGDAGIATDQPIADLVEATADAQPDVQPDVKPTEQRRERPSRSERPERPRRRRRDRDEDAGERVVAFGDHTPDFLLREVPVRRKASTDNSESAAA